MSKRTDRANYCMYLDTNSIPIGLSRYEYKQGENHTIELDFGNMIEGTNRAPEIRTIQPLSTFSTHDFYVVPVFAYKESRAAMKIRCMNYQHPNDYPKLIGDYKVLGFLYIYFDQFRMMCRTEFVKNRIEKDKEKIREILGKRKKAFDGAVEKSYDAERRRKIKKLSGESR